MSAIQDEIRQGRPFPTKGAECVVALLRTADLLRRRLSEVVGTREITLQQYNVLRILRGAGSAGLPTLEIGDRMIEQSPGITRLLDRLEAKGLVRRERCPRDRRQVTCRIAPSGLAILADLEEPMARSTRGLVGPLSQTRTTTLIRLLDDLRAAARAVSLR